MRLRWPAAVTAMGLLAAACGGADGGSGAGGLSVATAFYPLEWVTEQVGGAEVEVSNLTPAGAEPHDLELTPAQRDEIEDADLVVVMGNGFQPAVEAAAEDRDGPTVEVFAELASIDARGRNVADEHEDVDFEDTLDPHVWLDPVLMTEVVDVIAGALSELAPDAADAFAANAATVDEELASLDSEYAGELASCASRVLVTAHDAFGYLTARYDLEAHGAAGLSPDEEPDASRIAELVDLVADEGVTVVFTEELVSPAIAQTLAAEAGVDTDVLSTLEGLTAEEEEAGDDYVGVMRTNLGKIGGALGCS